MTLISRWHSAWQTVRGDFGQAFWPLVDQIVVTGSNFATNIIIARLVGVYQFGLYSLAWFCVLMALSVELSLIGAPLFNLAPRRPALQQPLYVNVLIVEALGFAGLFAIIAWLGARYGGLVFADWVFAGYAAPLAAAGAGYLWQDFMRRVLFARGRIGMVLLSDMISYPGQLTLLLLAALARPGLGRVLWIVAATSFLSAAIALWALRPLRLPRGELGSIVREQWQYARWLLGAVALSEVSKNLAYFVAGAVLGAASVAGMRAAELLFRVGNPFYQSLENFVPSQATRLLLDRGVPGFAGYMLRWTLFGLAVSLAISLLAIAAPGYWLGLLFGPDMAGWGKLVDALALRPPLVLLTMMGAIALRTRDATGYTMAAELCRTAIAAATVYPIVAGFGITGAALAHALWPLAAALVMAVGIDRSLRGERRTAASGGAG